MLSFQGGIRVPSYTASKSGVMGITRAMANEWAKFDIQINAIAPGYMATNNTAPIRADEERKEVDSGSDPGRTLGNSGGFGGSRCVLGFPASNYVNGYTVAVDGGWLAR